MVAIDRREEGVVVRLAGELDLYNASLLRDALLAECAAAPERLVIDLSEVEFIDSTALGVLVETRRRFANPKAVRLCCPGTETRRALHISGLDEHFGVHETVEEALTG